MKRSAPPPVPIMCWTVLSVPGESLSLCTLPAVVPTLSCTALRVTHRHVMHSVGPTGSCLTAMCCTLSSAGMGCTLALAVYPNPCCTLCPSQEEAKRQQEELDRILEENRRKVRASHKGVLVAGVH